VTIKTGDVRTSSWLRADPPARSAAAAVIGAGQAGLSAAYHLRRQGVEYVVLHGNRVGRAAATAVSRLLRAA
jgi:glycine/D-amino acid oxidase-like deaminating enzyme